MKIFQCWKPVLEGLSWGEVRKRKLWYDYFIALYKINIEYTPISLTDFLNLIFGNNFSPSSSSNNNDIDILNDEKALRARDETDTSK